MDTQACSGSCGKDTLPGGMVPDLVPAGATHSSENIGVAILTPGLVLAAQL